jgi:sugar lactone lactonase YvrE
VSTRIQTLDDGLFLPESPRWHNGSLWISDMLHRTVFRYDADGRKHAVAVFDDDQSGLGWSPSGELLAVTMRHRKLVRVDDKGFSDVADLSSLESVMLNDMAVAADGTAFITRFGFNPWLGGQFCAVEIIRVRPDGTVGLIGGPVQLPNGIALSPDERVLLVAESAAGRIVAIDDPLAAVPATARVFGQIPVSEASELGIAAPDGICVDSEGGVWVADPIGHQVVRLDRAGTVTDILAVAPDAHPVAVALGGDARTTLFIAVAGSTDLYVPRINPRGRIDYTEVAIPGM